MTIKKTRLMAVAAIAAVSFTAACSGSDDSSNEGGSGAADGTVELNFTWWGNDDRAARYNQAIELFQTENPNIKVNGNFSDFQGYWTARNTEAAGRALPDVMQFDLSYIREYGDSGHLLDLTEHVGSTIDTAEFEESLLASGAIDGAQIGIPTSTNTLALFVNTTLLEETGVDMLEEGYTWDDLNAWLAEINAAGVQKDGQYPVYGGGDYTGTFWFFVQWMVQQGKQPFNDDGTFNFTQDDVKNFRNVTSSLRDSDGFYPAERAAQLLPLGGFENEENVFAMTWDNFLAGYAAEVEGELAMLPMPSGSDGPKMFWKPSMLLSAGANTEHPEEAAQFIDFLVNNPEVGKIFGTSKGVPATAAQRDAMELEAGSVDEQVTQFEEDVADLVTEPTPIPVKGFGAIESEWLTLSEELAYGQMSVDDFASQWWSEAEMATS